MDDQFTMQPLILPSSLRQNRLYRLVYRMCGGLLFKSLAPFLLLFLLSLSISLQLRLAQERRESMAPAQRTLTLRAVKDASTSNHLLLAVILKVSFCYGLEGFVCSFTEAEMATSEAFSLSS